MGAPSGGVLLKDCKKARSQTDAVRAGNHWIRQAVAEFSGQGSGRENREKTGKMKPGGSSGATLSPHSSSRKPYHGRRKRKGGVWWGEGVKVRDGVFVTGKTHAPPLCCPSSSFTPGEIKNIQTEEWKVVGFFRKKLLGVRRNINLLPRKVRSGNFRGEWRRGKLKQTRV